MFRGTPIRDTLEAEGLIVNCDVSRYSYKEVVVRTRTLRNRKLKALSRYMLTRYYFRADYWAYMLRRMLRYPAMIPSLAEVFLWGVLRRSRLIFKFRYRGRWE